MPVPSTWADIFTNAAQNSPQGSEPLGNQADDYIRQAFAFAKQLHDGWLAADGTVKLTGALDTGGFGVKNLPAPVAATDAVTKSYVDTLVTATVPHGTVVMWWGAPNSVPAGWILCDGYNGTPNLLDRFPYGAGGSMGIAYGGNSFPVISTAQMPVHTHVVYDPGHAHGVYDGGHIHNAPDVWTNQPGNQVGTGSVQRNSAVGDNTTASLTGIGIYGSGTGISLYNAGGNAAFDNRPAFTAIYFIMKL
jgi:hypothetical protein